MMGGGIPPSLDRRERMVQTLLTFTAFLVIVGVLVMVGLRLARGAATPPLPMMPGDTLDAYRLENERASAYQVVRNTLDVRARTDEVIGVYCRDSRHTIQGRYWEFRGHVDVAYPEERVERHPYIVTLTGSADQGWTVISCEIQPVEE